MPSNLKTIHGPKGQPFLGVLKDFRHDPLSFVTDCSQNYGPLTRMPMAGFPFVLVSHPDFAKDIMDNDMGIFGKSRAAMRAAPLIGYGLLLTEGEKWKRSRKLATPAFHPKKLGSMIPRLEKITQDLFAQYKEKKFKFEVTSTTSNLTMDMFCETFLGVGSQFNTELLAAINGSLTEVSIRSLAGIAPPMWVPTGGNRRLKKHIATIDATINEIIAARRQELADGEPRHDLLSSFLQSEDENGGFSQQQIRDELVTFFVAGHETTAMVLNWLLHYLARYPEITAKVQEEVLGLDQDHLSLSTLRNLPYTTLVIKETMRLRPPIWMFRREAKQDYDLLGYEIKKGDICMINAYLLHRHPDFWEEPDAFKPERMEDVSKQHPGAFMPFGAGKRICIGMNFAMLEVSIFIATLLRNYDITPQPNLKVVMEPSATLKPRDRFQIELTRR